ncbi:MAG: YkgJ family cysteine cluster protein [Pirellulaceae bacterium]
MPLPIVTLKNDERWDCQRCGFCCRGSLILLSAEDAQRLRSQKWDEQPEYEKIRIMVRHRGAGSSYRLAHRDDGTCIFLNVKTDCVASIQNSVSKPNQRSVARSRCN